MSGFGQCFFLIFKWVSWWRWHSQGQFHKKELLM